MLCVRHASRLIPGARAVEIAGAGHLLPEVDPAIFAADVVAHLHRAVSPEEVVR